MSDITLYFDVVSPYSYFAFAQRDRIKAAGHTLHLRPASVRAIMEASGNVPTSVTCKPKMAYGQQDLARWARKLRVPVALHPQFGRFSSVPFLQMIAATSAGMTEAVTQAAFEAVWVDQAPVTDGEAMSNFFEGKLEDGSSLWNARETGAAKLEANNEAAVGAGAFGVPIFVAETGLYFGNDRIDFLLEDLAGNQSA